MWANTLSMYLNQVGKSYALDYKTLEEWEPFGDPSIGIASPSIPPYKPEKPQGPNSGKRGVTYEYTSSATDPDGDDIYYMFDWGDGTNTTWLGPYKSGEKVTASHSWEKRGTYEVRVKAKDFRGGQSGWSDPLEVKIKFSFNIQQYIEQSIVGMIIRLIRSFIIGW
ncbi:MAG: PKD domain-containing protein [Thermoplasmata archaeon]|nr:PKD domain-containing protein [Thermoplasmata archaeon]